MHGYDAHAPSHNVPRKLAEDEYICLGHGERHQRRPATDENALQALADDEYCSVECVLIHVAYWREQAESAYKRGHADGRRIGEESIRFQVDQERAVTADVTRKLELARRVIGESPNLVKALEASLEVVKGAAA